MEGIIEFLQELVHEPGDLQASWSSYPEDGLDTDVILLVVQMETIPRPSRCPSAGTSIARAGDQVFLYENTPGKRVKGIDLEYAERLEGVL